MTSIYFSLLNLEAVRSHPKVLADLILVRALFSFADGSLLAVSSHGGESTLVSPPSFKDTNPIMGALMASSKLITHRPHLLIPSHWGFHIGIGGRRHKHPAHHTPCLVKG